MISGAFLSSHISAPASDTSPATRDTSSLALSPAVNISEPTSHFARVPAARLIERFHYVRVMPWKNALSLERSSALLIGATGAD